MTLDNILQDIHAIEETLLTYERKGLQDPCALAESPKFAYHHHLCNNDIASRCLVVSRGCEQDTHRR